MRKILFFIIMIMAAAGAVAGQRFGGMITGRITDEAGAPMAGASVVIESLRAGVAADNDGRYALRGLRDGTYALRISFTGYEPLDTVVVVSGTAVIDASLREGMFLAEEVIVRGSRAGNRTPMAHSTVHASELRERDLTQGHAISFITYTFSGRDLRCRQRHRLHLTEDTRHRRQQDKHYHRRHTAQ